MTRFLVYQQIVTKQKTVKRTTYDLEVKMLVRKVEAETRAKAIKAFEQDTENIKRYRGSKIACLEFDLARTVKYKRRRKTKE